MASRLTLLLSEFISTTGFNMLVLLKDLVMLELA